MAPHIDDDQRRARLAWRHRLVPAERVDDPLEVARSLVAVHASDPASVHLSIAARMTDPGIGASERALYEDRTLVRMLGMRRTLFVVPRQHVGAVQASSTDDVAASERRKVVRAMQANDIAEPDARLDALETAALDALTAAGGAHTTELRALVPALDETITMGSGRWTAEVRLSSRVVFLLAADGRIVRGRPRGTWLSSQYRWEPTHEWLGAPPASPDADAARTDVARRWLRRFGPATLDDLVWWTGWTKTRTRRAVAALPTVEVTLDGALTGMVLADDVDPVATPPRWAALLPGLDATAMGWKLRDWYLGPHGDAVVDRNGNIGPTVWCDGRIVGGWTARDDGTVVHELLDDVDADGRTAIATEATRVEDLLAGTSVTPRFPAPLDARLRG